MSKSITFEEAKRNYPNRYTMESVPEWATHPAPNGLRYAPQYETDIEWFENTTFPKSGNGDCVSRNQTWPMGQWLTDGFSDKTIHGH